MRSYDPLKAFRSLIFLITVTYLLRRDRDKIRYKRTQEDFEQQKLILYLQILQTHLQGHFYDFPDLQGVTYRTTP